MKTWGKSREHLPFEPRGDNKVLCSFVWVSGLLLIRFLLSGGKTGEQGLVLLRVGLGFLNNDWKGTVAFNGWCFEFIGELFRLGRVVVDAILTIVNF